MNGLRKEQFKTSLGGNEMPFKNPEDCKRNSREYYQKNKEKMDKQSREWAEKNPERRKEILDYKGEKKE